MAIQKDRSDADAVQVTINNGDLQALRQIYERWGFKDEESVLRYALAVMTKAENQILYYVNGEGEKIGLQPSDAVKREAAGGAA